MHYATIYHSVKQPDEISFSKYPWQGLKYLIAQRQNNKMYSNLWMYFTYRKYIEVVIKIKRTNYFSEGITKYKIHFK